MTEALRMAGFAVMASLLSFILRAAHRQAGAMVAMAAGMMLFFFALSHLGTAVDAMRALADRSGVGRETVTLLLKLAAMAYVTEFSVQACRDAGEEGLAAKAALCGKTLLLAQTLPLILEIADLTLALAP